MEATYPVSSSSKSDIGPFQAEKILHKTIFHTVAEAELLDKDQIKEPTTGINDATHRLGLHRLTKGYTI